MAAQVYYVHRDISNNIDGASLNLQPGWTGETLPATDPALIAYFNFVPPAASVIVPVALKSINGKVTGQTAFPTLISPAGSKGFKVSVASLSLETDPGVITTSPTISLGTSGPWTDFVALASIPLVWGKFTDLTLANPRFWLTPLSNFKFNITVAAVSVNPYSMALILEGMWLGG